MKLTFKIIAILLIVGLLFLLDYKDRYETNESDFPIKELATSFGKGDIEGIMTAYESAWKMEEFWFPRKAVKQVIVYENLPLISRFTSQKLAKNQRIRFIKLLNDPSNFDWSETTWSIREADFIVRFFDENDELIGKTWVCLDECFMLKTQPFAPTTKFGHIITDEISQLLNANRQKGK